MLDNPFENIAPSYLEPKHAPLQPVSPTESVTIVLGDQSTQQSSPTTNRGSGPLADLFDATRGELVVDGQLGKSLLTPERRLDLELVVDAVPTNATLHSLTISRIIMLKGFIFPSDPESPLRHIKTLRVMDTSLESSQELFDRIADLMPHMEELDLSGSFLTNLAGIERVISQGLQVLSVKGGRIDNFEAMETVAKQVRSGAWNGQMCLRELDVRDNALPRYVSCGSASLERRHADCGFLCRNIDW